VCDRYQSLKPSEDMPPSVGPEFELRSACARSPPGRTRAATASWMGDYNHVRGTLRSTESQPGGLRAVARGKGGRTSDPGQGGARKAAAPPLALCVRARHPGLRVLRIALAGRLDLGDPLRAAKRKAQACPGRTRAHQGQPVLAMITTAGFSPVGGKPVPATQPLDSRSLPRCPGSAYGADMEGTGHPSEMHGFPRVLTSFIGREEEIGKVAGLLDGYRMVTVTGPGGVGKTRLACEVARKVAGRFADGVWLAELAAVQDATQVAAAVATAMGVLQAPGESAAESLVSALARQQVLLVLDNCEHVLSATAELCTALLTAADDLTVLVTGRERAGVAGEVRYRLGPLPVSVPSSAAHAEVPGAVALFADRARQGDPEFVLNGETGPVIAGLVARLDGMPLAIELAAARVEALGLARLAGRLDDSLSLLTSDDRAAPLRHRSLTATVRWSYQLLEEGERQVFRKLSAFPSPFTLDAAVEVAGVAAGPALLHLVDCSLVTPPRTGPDGQDRYVMLETLRAYGREQLASSGELAETSAALASYAVQVAEQAAAALETAAGETVAGRRLDAEEPVMQQTFSWAMRHDPPTALRIAIALTPWRTLRGRVEEAYGQLNAAVGNAEPGSRTWCSAQFQLGQAASQFGDATASLSPYSAARDALAPAGPSRALADVLSAMANVLINTDRVPEGAAEAASALEMARSIRYPAAEAYALCDMGLAGYYLDDYDTAQRWLRQACQIDPAVIPGEITRWCRVLLTTTLSKAGEFAAARDSCATTLALAREAGDLFSEASCLAVLADLDTREGHLAEAGAQLEAALMLAIRIRSPYRLHDCLRVGEDLCTAAGHWAEAATIVAAITTDIHDNGLTVRPQQIRHDEQLLRDAAAMLGPELAAAAEKRGSAMTLGTAAEYLLLLTETTLSPRATPQNSPRLSELSPREQELVGLVARGRTDAQIAGEMFISVSTVRSHLDRIRDKTGCRKRADLTRLALQAGLA